MRLTVIILIIFGVAVCSPTTAQKVTFSGINVPLEKIFPVIKKQTGYVFFYNAVILKGTKPVTIQVTNAPLESFLQQILKDQPLKYLIEGNNVFISRKTSDKSSNDLAPSMLNITGRIINQNGEPIIATIIVKGTDRATSSNAKGEFELNDIDEKSTLVISGVSIEESEIKINGRNDVLVKVRMKTSLQEEVVVSTGYQKISKERFVGSFSQLDSAAYERRAGMDILSRLDGTVTGVLFDKKAVSNQLSNIQIRGISTIAQSSYSASPDPLIIVDNFPFKQDINALNPNDILSITILKDAAAASIWGAQAGNGVIIITTKKGKYNQPLQVSFSSNVSFQEKPNLYYYPQMSVSDFIDMEILLFKKGKYDADSSNATVLLTPLFLILAKANAGKISAADSAQQVDALRKLDVRDDLDKYVYRTAISQQHYLNISGGNTTFNYNFSGGYNQALNNIQHSRPNDQFTLNFNSGFKPAKKLDITVGINYSQATQRSATWSLPGRLYPYLQLTDDQGKALPVYNGLRLSYIDTAGAGGLLDWKYYPLLEPGLTDRKDISKSIIINAGLSYKLTNAINVVVRYQYSNQTESNSNYHSLQTFYTRNLINRYTNLSVTDPSFRNPLPIGGILDLGHSESVAQNVRGEINFNKSFGADHVITGFISGDISERKGLSGDLSTFYGYNKETGSYKSSIDYSNPYPLYWPTPRTDRLPNSDNVSPSSKNRLVSFTGNASYTFRARYTFYASARKDGANTFGVNTNRKWKPLWSVGGSWDISRENFYHISWMPSLRFRTSYGFSGNPGNATGIATLTYGRRVSDLAGLIYAFPNDPPNPDIRWEKVKIINEGIDFTLLKGRMGGSMDVWQKTVTDIISVTPLPAATGVETFILNVASLKGHGFEFNLRSRNIQGIFTWETNFGLSAAKMIVTKLYNSRYRTAETLVSYGLNAREGQIAYGLVSYRWAGLDPMTGSPRGIINKQITQDYRAIGSDTGTNQVFHGSSIPLYSGNILNTLSWKGFMLSANITYRLDFYFRRPTISYENLVSSRDGNADYALRWQKTGDEKYTQVPSFIYPFPTTDKGSRDQFYQYSEVNVLRGDNVRLQDVRLQYNPTSSLLKKMAVKRLQVYLYVNNLNLVLWRKNKSDLDPDFVGGSVFTAPTAKTYTTGLSIGL